MKYIKYMNGTIVLARVDAPNSRAKKQKKTYETCLLIKESLQNIEKRGRRTRAYMEKNNVIYFSFHLRLSSNPYYNPRKISFFVAFIHRTDGTRMGAVFSVLWRRNACRKVYPERQTLYSKKHLLYFCACDIIYN